MEDDLKIASFLAKGLRQEGFAADHVADGEEGLYRALHEPYDAIIVDLMLPKLDGLSLIEEMRRGKVNTPVLILSARRTVDDRVMGLQRGGDDYLTKPFAFSELLARLQALLRRSSGQAQPTCIRVGGLTMDLLAREVVREGTKIDLQPREYDLLKYLLQNAGRVMSGALILEHIWGYGFDPQTNVVDVLGCRLRSKVDKNFETKLVQTVRGVGYVLRAS